LLFFLPLPQSKGYMKFSKFTPNLTLEATPKERR